MVQVSCKICSKEFYAKPSWINIGNGKYCSMECSQKSQIKGTHVKCEICKKEIWRTPSKIRRSKSRKYFCNKSCQTLWRNSIVYVGKNHPNWKNGGTMYRKILQRSTKEKICCLCEIKDERILAVHHIDKNRKNSKLENLIWLCHNCHFLVHHDTKTAKKLMEAIV